MNKYSVGHYFRRIFLLVLTGLMLAGIAGETLRAGVTGKITGTVTVQATDEPAIGVNVQLLETYLGAATDRNGDYFILQVPPGTYSLRISLIGYRDVVVDKVTVSADHTTRIDVVMEEHTVEMDEVVITAQRPLVQRDLTASIQFVGRAELLRLPVTDTEQGLMLQTGVLFDNLPIAGGLGGEGKGEARYAIRGGAQDQVKWYVDGVRTATLMDGRADRGGSFTSINIYAVEEIQILTGGYNAEYGEAQSGIVNVITRDGSNRISGSFEYIYGIPGKHHFGPYIYDITDTSIQEFRLHTVMDDDSNLIIGTLDTAWWTPYRQSQIYDYRKIPDRNVYFSLGGPLFKIGESNATFFGALQIKEQAYNLPHPQDTRDLQNGMLNIAIQFPPNKKLRLSAIYNHEAHSTLQEAGDFSLQAKYYRGWGSLLDTYTYITSAQWTHALSQELYYDLKLSQFLFDSREGPSKYHRVGESSDQDIWGYQYYEGYKDEPFHEYTWSLDNRTVTGDISLVGSLNWQYNTTNLLKSGFEYRYNTYYEKKALRFPSFTTDPDGWMNRGLPEKFHPIQFAAYLQDKMEFEGMILNLGVRYDHFNPNRDWFISRDIFNLAADPDYDPAADPDKDEIDSLGHIKYDFSNVLTKPRAPAPSYNMFSPRFGVAFPMTDKTVLHFSYGHFKQMPPLNRMFEFAYIRSESRTKAILAERDSALAQGREPENIPIGFGDPERVVFLSLEPLRPEKTISFEVGIEHNFERFGLLDVTAFYKDVFDQTEPRYGLFDRFVYAWDPFLGQRTNNRFYVSYFPGDYGDSRGFEITFRTLFSQSVVVDINYSFSKSTKGRASPRAVYFDLEVDSTATGVDTTIVTSYGWDVDVNKRIPVEKSFSRPQVLRANLYLTVPSEIGGWRVPGLLQGFSASLLYKYMSGQAYTYIGPDDPPDTYDNYRYPGIETMDLKVEKSFRFGDRFSVAGYTLVTNVLNTKNIRAIGGFFDVNAIPKFLETGEVTTIDAAGYNISWQTYYEPRRISVGMRVDF